MASKVISPEVRATVLGAIPQDHAGRRITELFEDLRAKGVDATMVREVIQREFDAGVVKRSPRMRLYRVDRPRQVKLAG